MNKFILILSVFFLCLSGCKSAPPGDQSNGQSSDSPASNETSRQGESKQEESNQQANESGGAEKIEALPAPSEESGLEIATFAGGCFWCVEPPFDKTKGVERTIVGYTGGEEQHPTYKEVAGGKTSHAEAIRVYYDPDEVSYEELLDVFWRQINPTQKNGQFVDIGAQYRTAIFVHDDEQRAAAEASKKELADSGRFDAPIVTEIVDADTFWKAEEYHQNFYKKSPGRYNSYRSGSGRDEFIEKHWGSE